MEKTIQERAAEWLKSGKTGASSKTIHNFFSAGVPSDPHYPHDSADFGRCVGLLEAVPEWQNRLGEMAAIPGLEGQVWAALAEVWLALQNYYFAEDMDTLNQRLKEIIEPLEKASGRVVRIGKNAKMTIPQSSVEAVALANYLAVTRKAGISDEFAKETYAANKTSADALAALQIKHTIEAGESMKDIAGLGHNSGEPPAQDVGGVSGQRLKAFLDRVERLEEEKSGIAEDIKDIFAEAKATGFDTKTMRKVLRLRKMDKEKRVEEEQILELYKAAIGMD